MTPERWRKIESIFQTVIEKPKPERQMMLTQYCGDDTELRREVEALLNEDETNEFDDFIQAPIKDVARSLPMPNADNYIGRKIGPYNVVKLLGQGGMGAVYLAERADAEYYRQVALKIVKRGMDSSFVLKRFRVERQILATLEHPNIAQLLDGGSTEDGLPYFVMEYVQGQALTEYCNASQLSLADRLKLFLPVCAAVQHAHQKLIVHRDLKPSNILVTSDGTPKLLDFGIAKLLDPALSPTPITRTLTSMRMMTPDYASPEQVRGLPITAASDVYSLGVVLYELLAGERPYQFDTYSPAEIERAICDTEVERPSALAERMKGESGKLKLGAGLFRHSSFIRHRSSLRGDLDNIVLMALRKEPDRRYQSVEQLAEDIRCYLTGRPISARRESTVYRAGKFVRRHKLGVTAAALILFSLLGGIVATTRAARIAQAERARAEANLVEAQAQRAEADRQRLIAEEQRAEALTQRERAEAETVEANLQRQIAEAQRAEAEAQRGNAETQQERAERRFAQVRKLANTFLFDLHDQIATLPGSTAAREIVVRTALDYLNSLTKDAEGDVSLQKELAAAYLRIGEVQGDPLKASLKNYAAALESHRNSIELIERLLAAGKKVDPATLGVLARAYVKTGYIRHITGSSAPATELLQNGLKISQRLIAENTRDETAYDTLLIAEYCLDMIESQNGNEAIALAHGRQMVMVSERWVREMETNSARGNLAFSYQMLGQTLAQSGELNEAHDFARRALSIQQELCRLAPNDVNQRNRLASIYCALGATTLKQGDAQTAASHYKQCVQINEEQVARDPKDGLAMLNLHFNYYGLGTALAESNPAEAVEVLKKALDRGSNTPPQPTLSRVYHLINLATAFWKMGDRQNSRLNLREAQNLMQSLPPGRLTASGLGHHLQRQTGLLLLEMGDEADALVYFRQAVQSIRTQVAAKPQSFELRRDLPACYLALGKYHATIAGRSGISVERQNLHWREARDWYQQGLTALQERVKQWPRDTQSSTQIEAVFKLIAQCDATLAQLAAKQQR